MTLTYSCSLKAGSKIMTMRQFMNCKITPPTTAYHFREKVEKVEEWDAYSNQISMLASLIQNYAKLSNI